MSVLSRLTMATDAEAPPRIRPLRPTFTVGLVDPETKGTMNLKITHATKSGNLQEMIAARLLHSTFSSSSSRRRPIGVLVDDVCVPFEGLYESIAALTDEQRKSRFEVIFSASPSSDPSSHTSSDVNEADELNSEETSSNRTKEWAFQPIGYVQSCWPRKNGCPRQGILTPSSRATIRIQAPGTTKSASSSMAADALDGLATFSHVWLIFIFHANQEARESGSDTVGSGHIRPKVHPPRMGGKSIGLYATRSPHRFVPIGLTAAVLERVEGDTIHLSGVDLIEGTPILDIKPYVPAYDSIPSASHPEAAWIEKSSSIASVAFEEDAVKSLHELASHCTVFNADPQRIQLAITESLLSDPRSVYRKTKCADDVFGFRLDNLSINCSVKDDVATVHSIVLHSANASSSEE